MLEAIAAANAGHAGAYGADPWTARAEALVAEHFGGDARAFFVFNGTGANVASIDALTRPFEAVICTDVAHMHVDECGAPERLAGAKLLTVAAPRRQAQPRRRRALGLAPRRRAPGRSPRVVSITQSTELGTLYRLDEMRAIADAAHAAGMRVHVDGARLANAAAALDVSLARADHRARASTWSRSAGPRTGSLFGEAVVFCAPSSAATSSSPASSSASCRRRCASSPPSSRRC